MIKFKERFIGDRAFYRRVLAISVPIMIQMGITNFVSLLDNVMVGRLSTEAMSGVSIVNQFIFVFNLLIFGAISAAGIFTAQYYGKGDTNGVRSTFRFKLVINVSLTLIGIAIMLLLKDLLISSFLHDSDSAGDLAATYGFGKEYLHVMVIGLLPYAISQVYASTLRETGETVVPMFASLSAVAINLVLNYILIFGKLGAAPLGVTGAAIATVISRFGELVILVVWTHLHKERAAFIRGAYRSLRVPIPLLKSICIKGLPLVVNEVMFALALTVRNQFYSTRGLDVVASLNIAMTIINLFNVVYLALGSAVSIVIGNLLGAGRLEEAKRTDTKMIAFSIFASVIMSVLLVMASPFIPLLYNTSADVKGLATYMLTVAAFLMPFQAFSNACYYTVRAGGRVAATMILDSGMLWTVIIPLSFLVTHLTGLDIVYLYPICQAFDITKCIFGVIYLGRGTWVRRLVSEGGKE